MPVEQPVLDTNYKHLKAIRTWQKTTIIKTIITIAIIVAYRGENKIKCLRRRKKKATKNRVVGGRGETVTDRERRRRGGGRGSDRKKEMLDVWARNLSLLKRSYLREGAEQTEMASTQIVNGGSEVQSQSIAGCWCEKQPSTKILLPQ